MYQILNCDNLIKFGVFTASEIKWTPCRRWAL